jgi:hypothetical protein
MPSPQVPHPEVDPHRSDEPEYEPVQSPELPRRGESEVVPGVPNPEIAPVESPQINPQSPPEVHPIE